MNDIDIATPESSAMVTRLIEADEGHYVRHPAGADMTIKVFSVETGGTYSMMEAVLPPGGIVPRHMHANEDENAYIVEGEMRMTIGDITLDAKAGSMVMLPRGIVQSFHNPGAVPCRFITTFVPGGAEGFFHDIGDLMARRAPGKPTQDEIKALQQKYRLTYFD